MQSTADRPSASEGTGPLAPTRPPSQVRRVVLGLLPSIFLGAIDGSIVPVALLTIGRALGDVSMIAWVMTGYLVAGTVATPIYGKLSDLYGRRRMLLWAVGIAALGSLGSALAVSMPMLIAARIVQGLGSGALFALGQAAAADVIHGPERGRWQGYFSGVFATAALSAPLLGGFLTQHLSWRAVFWINLPLAAVAALCVMRSLPPATVAARIGRIDAWGAVLLASGLGVILVAIARVGQGAGWLGSSTLGLLTMGAALLGLWLWRESDAPEPIVPISLFANRVVLAACAVNALNFFVLIGSTVLLPLSMQTLGGARADEVAMRLIALTLATPAGAFTAGRLMLRWPRLGMLSAIGSVLAALGLAALGVAVAAGAPTPLWAMVPLGYGLGMTLPTVLVAAQGAVGPALIGVVTALVSFFRSLGGVIGIAVLTSMVLAAQTDRGWQDTAPSALAAAFAWAFGTAACTALLAAALALRLGHLRPTRPG